MLKILTSPLSLELFLRTGKRLMLCQFIKRGNRMISETTDLFLYVLLLVRLWRELLPKDCSYILECMVRLQKISMAFVKEDHVLPNWLPCIMTGLLFLISSLHPELMRCFLTGLKRLTKLVTACYCPSFTGMAYAVKYLKGLTMIFAGQENPFIIFRSKEMYIFFKTNNKIPINLLK